MWVPVAVRRVANCYTPFTLLFTLLYAYRRNDRESGSAAAAAAAWLDTWPCRLVARRRSRTSCPSDEPWTHCNTTLRHQPSSLIHTSCWLSNPIFQCNFLLRIPKFLFRLALKWSSYDQCAFMQCRPCDYPCEGLISCNWLACFIAACLPCHV